MRVPGKGLAEPGRHAGRRRSGGRVLAGVLALAASLGAAAYATVPPPVPGSSVITVKTGGDRTGGSAVGPLAGVSLALYSSEDAATPIAAPWAQCTSDADGDCSFVVPDTDGGGANEGARYYVGQPENGAPAGWYTNTSLRTGAGSGSGSVQSSYRFPTPALEDGRTYSSTGDFMFSSDYAATPYVASGGIWQQSRNNPELPEQCGLDVALVLDLSASVGSALPDLKAAANGFTDALAQTPSRMALFSFDRGSPSTGTANHPELMPVSTQSGADAFKDLYADWALGSGTNWDQGLYAVANADPRYDAVVVLTDGNPTYWNNPRQGDGSHTHFADVEGGIFAANAVKAKGSRVVAVGVGRGVEGVSGLNLRAISGPEAFDGSNPLTADHYQTADFAGAGQALTELALSNCAGTLSVVKQIVPEDNTGEDVTGSTPAGEGWEFTATTTTPGIGGLPDTQETTADRTGAVSFNPTYPAGTDSADIAVTEDQRPGYDLITQGGLNAVCTDLDTGEPVQVTNTGTTGNPGFGVDVPRLSAVSCTMYNRPQQDEEAEITVEKEWLIDGVPYEHDDRPDGYEANLTLTGPGADGPTSQEWGADRDGYTLGDTTTIAETVTVPNACTLDSSRIVSANGSPADEPLPYEAQLTETENTFTVRNTVSCLDEDESRLTLVKRVINQHGGTAQPGDWTLSADGPENLSGTSGSAAVTDVTVPSGTYTLGETGGPEGYRPTGWECEDSEGDDVPVTNDQVTLEAGDAVTCTLTNKEHSTPPSPTPTPHPTDDYGYGHGDDGYGNRGH
ncbi:VWA domain-containing protein [Streptomyces sp. YPW6]|uniref:prealbumin-like fold domain-containing protein n=1 Tax=Streptomyces sp. YPW6 TaxID=2840373 RepID=UPI001C0C0F74|nr:VWA domain-containing protein [Streptomyces sp. YPW6]QWQ44751.1 VWA domain-containing protein [Streptomyces sp. YPW6]